MTELETVMVDWVGRMMDLPKELLPYTDGCTGGGVIQVHHKFSRELLKLQHVLAIIFLNTRAPLRT